MSQPKDSSSHAQQASIVVVGLGQASDGHQWLQQFFAAVPAASTVSFVVVYHADQQERLTERLREFATLPIVRIKNNMPIQGNTIYVSPRKASIALKNGKFRVSLKQRPAMPIDALMRSVAGTPNTHAAGVLLSSGAGDGDRGLAALMAADGVALRYTDHGGRADKVASELLAQVGHARGSVTSPKSLPGQPESQGSGQSVEHMLAELNLRERAIGALDCGIMIVDIRQADQPIIYVNDGFERVSGYVASEMIGRNCRFLQGPETDQASIVAMRMAIAAREDLRITLVNYRKDRSKFWNELRLTPIRDPDDVTTHYVGVATDVTPRVMAEQALRDREAQLRTLLDSTAEAIYGLDLEGRCTFCNPVCVQMLGYDSADELIGKNMHTLIHHTRADGTPLPEESCVLFRAFRANEKAHSVTQVYWRKDGSNFAVECWSHPTHKHGEVNGAVVTFLDITTRNEVAGELLRRTRALETINRTNIALAGELDLDKLVHKVTDAGREITNAQMGAFFYNVVDDSGDTFTLFALSGAGHDDFAGMPMPRRTAVFEPTFSGLGIVRSGDITKDERYGHTAPHFGMPVGHPPVRSFLGAPVVSRSGEALGGLVFGHARRDVFTEEHEELLRGLAAQAAVAIDNARLFEAAQKEIAERKQVEKALEEARRAADFANESKSAFLANMSHEIRTPMTSILGYADILAANTVDPDNRNCVDVIKRNGRFLLDIVDDILDLSRIESGQMSVVPSKVRLAELVSDVRSLMEVRAQENGLPLRIDYVGKLPLFFETDVTRLRQILINLISNAIKFTKQGQITLAVSYERQEDTESSRLRFDVIDTGIGMTSVQIEKIFLPFCQADDSITRQYGGTGLGLSISHRLATMLGGEIKVVSEPNVGSRFSLFLPVAYQHGSELVAPLADIGAGGNLDEPLRGRLVGRVLVVDDRRDIRYLAQYFLEEAGARVTTAENGRDALNIIAQCEERDRPFELVLMDMQMPVLDGFTATRTLRARGYTRPIVALTAGAFDADRKACLDAGCDDHIAKPIEGPRLVRRVAGYLGTDAGDGTDARDDNAIPKSKSKTKSSDKGTAMRLLIVDDGIDAARALCRLLEMRGHNVALAHDGAAALDEARATPPDAVILDLGLPDISGYEVARRLRAEPDMPRFALIALSGDQARPERLDEAGFDHYLQKPASIDAIEALLIQEMEHG